MRLFLCGRTSLCTKTRIHTLRVKNDRGYRLNSHVDDRFVCQTVAP